ncbi:hypothetical protein D3C81_2192780 [compost metagenome]
MAASTSIRSGAPRAVPDQARRPVSGLAYWAWMRAATSLGVSTLPTDTTLSSMARAGVDITPWAAMSAMSVTLTISASRPRLLRAC